MRHIETKKENCEQTENKLVWMWFCERKLRFLAYNMLMCSCTYTEITYIRKYYVLLL